MDWTTIYPIGYILFMTTSTNPNTIYIGTTWVRYAKGQVLVGVNEDDSDFTAGKTGGEKTHKLTINEMPSHSHPIDIHRSSSEASGFGLTQSGSFLNRPMVYNDQAITMNTQNNGSGNAHNILQPYIAVYVWRRTS